MTKSKPISTKTKRTTITAITVRVVVSVVLIALAAIVLARNWATVEHSVNAARQANLRWLAAGLLLMLGTFCIAAAIYGTLAFHQLRYRQTVLVEIATAFVNKLLPAGIGGLGLHGVYLYKRSHTATEATVVVSMNNLIGMLAHLLLLGMLGLFQPGVLRQLLERWHISFSWWAAVAVLVIVGLFMVPSMRRLIAQFLQNLGKSFRQMRLRTLVRATLLAMLLTLFYTGIVITAARSVGIDLSPLQIFVVFSIGMLSSTATPTPGGLIGAEAGLFAGFVAYGVSPALAGAATLLYRLVSYWMPLVPGAAALILARRLKIV